MSRRVVDAVLDLLVVGSTLTTLTMVDLAQRTGISRNSLYRRWTSKEALYGEVVSSMLWELPELADQSARENLITLCDALRHHFSDPRMRRFDRALNAEAENFPQLHGYYLDDVIGPWIDAVRFVIRRGKETREIRFDVGEDVLVAVIASPVLASVNHAENEVIDAKERCRLIIELVFDGASPM